MDSLTSPKEIQRTITEYSLRRAYWEQQQAQHLRLGNILLAEEAGRWVLHYTHAIHRQRQALAAAQARQEAA